MTESHLSEDQMMRRVDDGFILTATLPNTWRLKWWILSKSGDIEVLKPIELRKEIKVLLTSAAAKYTA